MSIQFYNGKPQKIFNPTQKSKNYVTFGDIEDVAYQTQNNYFYLFNFFANIQVARINGITGVVFQYFYGLSENIQTFINNTRTLLTNYTYNPEKNLTTIYNDFRTLDVTCNNVASTNLASNTININKVNCNKITNNMLISKQINCNTMKCNYLEFKNDTGLFLYLNAVTFPINKSLNKSELNFTDSINSVKITLKPNYSVQFFKNGAIQSQINNSSDNIMYYQNVTNLDFTEVKLFYRNILLT